MAWVRIDDASMTHPKVVGLSDKAFRLWVWGLAYCQQHLTDGFIPAAAVVAANLRTAVQLVLASLWDARESGGWDVHDYLDWNDSRDLVNQRRTEAKERMAKARGRRSKEVRANNLERTSREVPLRLGSLSDRSSERESEGKPRMQRPGESISYEPIADELQDRAAHLVERYAELFYEHRLGAKYRSKPSPDYEDAKTLVPLWDDRRLEKLAVLVLTTDDPWISNTDRSFKIFALKASWADDKLRAWETEHGVAV